MKKLITTAFMSLLFVAGVYAQNCSAGFTSSVNGSTVSFTNTSVLTNPAFGATGYNWNFDDGNYGNATNPSHTYSTSGIYVVCLTAWVIDSVTGNSCSDTYCDTVVISSGSGTSTCNALFSVTSNGSNPLSVILNDASTHASYPGSSISYSWDMGDGTTGNIPGSVAYTYASSGAYGVCLTITVTDTSNNTVTCSDTYCDTVVVNNAATSCQASFIATPDTFNGVSNGFIFSGYSGVSPFLPYNITYSWDYGDGDTGIGSWNTHNYASAGTYIVCLTVTVIDSGGAGVVCTSTYCDSVVFSGSGNPAPTFCTASYWVDTATSSAAAINVYNNSTPLTSASYVTSYFWDFGDGSSSTQQFPTHSYATSGLYNLCLTITSVDQNLDTCMDTYCHTLGIDSLGNLYFKTNGPGFTLNILDPASIGLSETVLNDVSIYPNPSAGAVTLDLGTQLVGETTWSLYDLKGVNIANGNASDIQTTIDVSELSNGIYLLTIENGAAVSNQKLQILK